MTSHITNRVRNAARTAQRNADAMHTAATQLSCPQARGIAAAEAIAWTQFARVVMGDIGEEQEETEVVPLHNPAEEPLTVPTPVPA